MAVAVDVLSSQSLIAGKVVVAPSIGAAMRELRERCGFTQERLSVFLELRRETLSRIEGDLLAPTVQTVQRLSGIVALFDRVRQHVAETEASGRAPDDAFFDLLGKSLRLPKSVASEVDLAAMISYDRKKSGLIRELEGSS